MKVAIPVSNGVLCMHFGHCDEFAVADVKTEDKSIGKVENMTPPPHEPGVLPKWLSEMGVELVIAGGMGSRARQLFESAGVQVIVGAPSGKPEEIISAYFNNSLETGRNVCDH